MVKKNIPVKYSELSKEAAYYLHKGFLYELNKIAERIGVTKLLGRINTPSVFPKGLQTIPKPSKIKSTTSSLKEQKTAINY
jgi:hypothetical protein